MDALERLRGRIAQFPGYSGDGNRRLSDRLVRSYLGEALALLSGRLAQVEPASHERLNDAILRAEFTNQATFRVFEYADLDAPRADAVASKDVELLDLADRATQVDSQNLRAYLDEVTVAFDARDKAMSA